MSQHYVEGAHEEVMRTCGDAKRVIRHYVCRELKKPIGHSVEW